MDNFDLGRLTDFDFENICKDILERKLGHKLEIFAKGRDSGIDLRHFGADGSKLIVQCKHWIKSSASSLRSHVVNDELPKVKRLNPDRYILATSTDLSRAAKDALWAELTPYVNSPSDILGLQDILSELRGDSEIVRRHIRLWLSGTEILRGVLNQAVLLRSSWLREELDETVKTYVPNASVTRAHELLDRHNVCIISGNPGIGKTTLARILAVEYVSKGYELVEISEDITELLSTWDDEAPQVFYYDDFLGQTTAEEKLGKNEDRRLITALHKLQRSSNKVLLLTTREYMLAQAKQKYERLAGEKIELLKFVLDLESYTVLIRAEILYNHVFYCKAPPDLRSQFSNPENYLPIIQHKNFSPRLVASSLELFDPLGEGEVNLSRDVLANLDNPTRIWRHVVEEELDPSAVHLLEVLWTLGGRASLEVLNETWKAYSATLGRVVDYTIFTRALRTTENSMVQIMVRGGTDPTIIFHNPSIRDFMRDYLVGRPTLLKELFASFSRFEQIENTWVAASGWNGGKLREFFMRNRGLVVDSTIRVLQMESGNPVVKHAAAILKLSDFVSSHQLADAVIGALDVDWADYVSDGDDIVSILRTLSEERYRERIDFPAIREAGISWALADTSDWDNLRFAESILEGLGDMASGELEMIRSEMIEFAVEKIDGWRDSDAPSYVNWGTLDEVLEFASTFGDPDDLFPGYSSASSAMDSHRETVDTRYETSGLVASGTKEDSSVNLLSQVQDLMTLLDSDN